MSTLPKLNRLLDGGRSEREDLAAAVVLPKVDQGVDETNLREIRAILPFPMFADAEGDSELLSVRSASGDWRESCLRGLGLNPVGCSFDMFVRSSME